MDSKELLNKIRNDYPWIYKKNQPMIIGDDIDAIISACFLHNYLGWNIKGFYIGYNTLFIEKNHKKWNESIFVDLDISQNEIKSIGHHILQISKKDKIIDIGHNNSLNPNLLRNRTMEDFLFKYPLGTIHFLCYLFDKNLLINNDLRRIIWIPDSTWINGQSHRFRKNVTEWIKYFQLEYLRNDLDYIDTKKFEEVIDSIIYPEIQNTGFFRGSGQVKSKHLGLGGYQCQFINPKLERKKISKLIELICNTFSWKIPEIPYEYYTINGIRKSEQISNVIIKNNFSNFIIQNNIFSYVIPNYNRINYTIFKFL